MPDTQEKLTEIYDAQMYRSKQKGRLRDGKTERQSRRGRGRERSVFIVPAESEGSIVRRLWGLCRVTTGGTALWPAQLSFLVSSRGLYLAAPQRCHCDLFKAMSSSRYDNMSLVLRRHHKIALAKKQITSIDPAPYSFLF